MDIGTKIRKVRLAKGYSQEYMANEIQVSQRTYGKLENGQSRFDLIRLGEVTRILDIDLCHLLMENTNGHTANGRDKNVNLVHREEPLTTIKLIHQYEQRIKNLESEILFLRRIIENFQGSVI